MQAFQEKYQAYLTKFNDYLSKYMQAMPSYPAVLMKSMQYSLEAGGKRIRPVLLLAVADMLGVASEEALPFALALEMIHTYSLIHDDLPAMDNDDFRRGKPSNHKVFGEANAILAGDGLLNTAYEICMAQALKGAKYVRVGQVLGECAGINGMIAGQVVDLACEAKAEKTEEDLFYIHKHKTGKLLLAPVLMACLLAEYANYRPLENFAEGFGLLFQITDDILDELGDFEKLGKTIGKDKQEDKLTFVKLYGLEGAKTRAEYIASDCCAYLEGVDGDVAFLRDLVLYVKDRTS